MRDTIEQGTWTLPLSKLFTPDALPEQISVWNIFRLFLWWIVSDRFDDAIVKYLPSVKAEDGTLINHVGDILFSEDGGYQNVFFKAAEQIRDKGSVHIPLRFWMEDQSTLSQLSWHLEDSVLTLRVSATRMNFWTDSFYYGPALYLLNLLMVAALERLGLEPIPGEMQLTVVEFYFNQEDRQAVVEFAESPPQIASIYAIHILEAASHGFNQHDLELLFNFGPRDHISRLMNFILAIPGDYGKWDSSMCWAQGNEQVAANMRAKRAWLDEEE